MELLFDLERGWDGDSVRLLDQDCQRSAGATMFVSGSWFIATSTDMTHQLIATALRSRPEISAESFSGMGNRILRPPPVELTMNILLRSGTLRAACGGFRAGVAWTTLPKSRCMPAGLRLRSGRFSGIPCVLIRPGSG
jgi:hypothetical protein